MGGMQWVACRSLIQRINPHPVHIHLQYGAAAFASFLIWSMVSAHPDDVFALVDAVPIEI